MDLQAVYRETLRRCAPEHLVRLHVNESMPRNVVAIGKAAGALLDGVAAVMPVDHAFVAVPEGYRLPVTRAEVHIGGHPRMTTASLSAGRALLKFIDAHDDVLFLISGGGSACVEVPLAPYSESDVAARNDFLLASGMSISEINAERKRMSAIKGGRLRDRVRGRSTTLVYSDVSDGALADVASGPTITSADEATLIADNHTLTNIAAAIIGDRAVLLGRQVECDVAQTARLLADRADALPAGSILVAGGEPTVVVQGSGRGGRCSELAVRFALLSRFEALFASSDGIDGSSGCAGIHLPARTEPGAPDGWADALNRSDSFPIASQLGEPIMIAPGGNNLRDLFLVARD